MSELLPCPFCGGEPYEYVNSSYMPYLHTSFNIVCLNDNCFVKPIVACDSKEEAVAAWNTMVERTCTLTTEEGNNSWYLCSACYADIYMGYRPTYCPSCGAKVVEE